MRLNNWIKMGNCWMADNSAPLRVVFVTTGYPTQYRPKECIFLHRSVKTLSQKIDARVIHLRSWRPGRPVLENRKWEHIDVISISCPQLPLGSYSHLNTILLSIFAGWMLKQIIDRADILHSLDIYPAGFVASRWARRSGKPHTTHVIGSDLGLFLIPNLSRMGTQWLLNMKGAVCNSQATLDQLISVVPEMHNLKVIHRGVDPLEFSPAGPASGPQVTLPPMRFLYLGGFHTWDSRRGEYNIKGGHTLLDAWRQVEEQVAPGSLVIAGPSTDTENLRLWRAGLRRPQAVFLAGTIPPGSVAAWMRACDVVVIPSLQEGLPNVANEAQACGRPVLGSDAGGIPESVIDGETGRIVPRRDPSALARGMQWFCANQAVLPAMGRHGRERMVRDFSWDHFSREMMAFYSGIL
jgi:glycosyltransferase involved in cell wall biosynthesis